MIRNILFLIFFLPFFCYCLDSPFLVTELSAQICSEIDPVIKKELLINGINNYTNQIIQNGLFFNEKGYNLYIFQYYTLVALKKSVINSLVLKAPHLSLAGIPEIIRPSLPFWMSFSGFLSGWFCFFILLVWIYVKK